MEDELVRFQREREQGLIQAGYNLSGSTTTRAEEIQTLRPGALIATLVQDTRSSSMPSTPSQPIFDTSRRKHPYVGVIRLLTRLGEG